MITADKNGELSWINEHRFFIIQWIGCDKYYVRKTYCQRVIASSNKIDAKMFDNKTAKKYLLKLQQLNTYGDFEIRERDLS